MTTFLDASQELVDALQLTESEALEKAIRYAALKAARYVTEDGEILSPAEYKRHGGTQWNNLFSDWFYVGLEQLDLTPKEGIDQNAALRHVRAVMGSYEPKHEHKEAAVAYLLSEWFERPTWRKKRK